MSAIIDASSPQFSSGNASGWIRNAVNSVVTDGRLTKPVIIDCRGFDTAQQSNGRFRLSLNIYGDLSVSDNTPCVFLWGPQTFHCDFDTIPPMQAGAGIAMRANHHHILYGTRFVMEVPQSLFGYAYTATTVATTEGSPIITVSSADAAVLEVGQCIAIHGHVPRGGTDTATLTSTFSIGTDPHVGVLAGGRVNPRGFDLSAAASRSNGPFGYLLFSSGAAKEIVQYWDIDRSNPQDCSFRTSARGWGGTCVQTWSPQSTKPIQRVVFETYIVRAISGTQVTLDAPVGITATAMPARFGASNCAIDGFGIIDGGRLTTDNRIGLIQAYFARNLQIGRGILIQNSNFSGVSLIQCMDCVIDGVFRNNGTRDPDLGAHVWVFGNCKRNTIFGSYEGGVVSVAVDDRSVYAQDYDNASDHNIVRPRQICGTKSPIKIEGGSYNVVTVDVAVNAGFDVIRASSEQWINLPRYEGNVLETKVVQFQPGVSGRAIYVDDAIMAGTNSALVRAPGTTTNVAAFLPHASNVVSLDITSSVQLRPDLSQGSYFKITNTWGSMVLGPPQNAWPGAQLVLDLAAINNNQLRVSFVGPWKLQDNAKSFMIYTNKRMTLTFHFDGTHWMETARTQQI